MSLIGALFSESPYFIYPTDWLGWVGLFIWLGIIGILAWNWRGQERQWGRIQWVIFFVLLILTPVSSLILGIRLPAGDSLPLPGITVDPLGAAVMLLSALPWVLAAGLLGSISAAIIAFFAGLILAFWGTHSLYTPLEISLLAVIFSAALSQRYRTFFYRSLRSPIVAGLLTSIFHPLLYLVDSLLWTAGPLAVRVDYAATHLVDASLAFAVPLILAGIVGELVRLAFPRSWGAQQPWEPSPPESSLEKRLIHILTPLALLLIIILMVGDWVVAGDAAQQMLEARMAAVAESAAEGIPTFLDVGQSLIMQAAADQRMDLGNLDQLDEFLEGRIYTIPYFREYFVLNADGSFLAGYPSNQFSQDYYISLEEQAGINLALSSDVLIQIYTIPPLEDESSARISFIAKIPASDQHDGGILIGRTDLVTNPFASSIITSLKSLDEIGGDGYLLDENNRILYHPDPTRLMHVYSGADSIERNFYDENAPDGTRLLGYAQLAIGRPWKIVLTVPAQVTQQQALNIAAPLLVMIIILAAFTFVMLRVGVKLVTSSLLDLTTEADKIAAGDLAQSLAVTGDDEVAQLRRSFEQMRTNLKARLDELNRLLLVSQGVAASLDVRDAVQPILESALSTGACSARVVLTPSAVPENAANEESPLQFGLGEETDSFSYLDQQILHLMQDQTRIVITNPARTPMVSFQMGVKPAGLLAVALRHENKYYGVLWLAYDSPHNFSEEELRFQTTLAGQAALAAANAHLFMTAEIERKRLASILASTPDPVLVTDHRDQILLVNPAAWQVLGLRVETGKGKPITEVIAQPKLQQLLRASSEEPGSAEISLADGSTYLATASSILAEGQHIGRVCVLRDITYFKELDALKSEFVSTVSHDLRSPLTLMRGYATMLEMVGDLNEQQSGYVRKIVVGVESMSRLVNNLLDLGRIEAEVGLQLEMVPIHDIVERVTESLSLQATQKRIQLHVDIPQQTIPLVEADQALLQQALHNLVENAIKYTPTDGKIWLTIHIHQNRMVFEVRDTGIGISPVDIPRVFEKFYRSTSREAKKERGTGLGLAIVKSIAERHGGEVWVESRLGKGSKFSLAIPLKQTKKKE